MIATAPAPSRWARLLAGVASCRAQPAARGFATSVASRQPQGGDNQDPSGLAPSTLSNVPGLVTGGGWYAPDSIERRLRKPRGPPKAGAPASRPRQTDEDFWAAAGAPGYGEDLVPHPEYKALSPWPNYNDDEPAASSEGKEAAPAAAAAAAHSKAETATPAPSAPPSSAPAAASAAAPSSASTASHYRLVRSSRAFIKLATLPSFTLTYENALLPVLASRGAALGLLASRLTVAGFPTDASRNAIAASTFSPSRGQLIPVIHTTVWRDAAAMEAAMADAGYAAAVTELAEHFRSDPAAPPDAPLTMVEHTFEVGAWAASDHSA